MIILLVLGGLWATTEGQENGPAAELQHLGRLPLAEISGKADAYFHSLGLPELLGARDLLAVQAPGPKRDLLVNSMLERWGWLDGAAALAYSQTQKFISQTDAVSCSLLGWASKDPARAWDEIMILSNRGADRRFGVVSVLTAVAEQDLDLALRCYEDLQPDRACLECAALHLMIAAEKNASFLKVRFAAERMPRGPLRDALWAGYWNFLGQYLPEWGLGELNGIGGSDDAKSATAQFCRGWAYLRFDDCMDFILRKVSGGTRDELILATVQVWARNAVHEDVVRVLKTLPTDLGERALLGLAATLASIDAQATLAWLEPFPHSEVRSQALGRAMRRWATLDHETARAYLLACEDTETRGILLWDYLQAKLRNGTFNFEELALIETRYSQDWRVRLLESLTVGLADPANNQGGRYELKKYAEVIKARSDLTDELKAKILKPFNRKP